MRNFIYVRFYFIFQLQSTTMRKTICFVTVIFLFTSLSAQQRIDSLQRLLMHATEDTARSNLMNRIASNYVESKPDSSLKYANDALTLSKQTNYKKGEIEAIRNLAAAFLMAGDYSKALEYSLDALKKSEMINNKELIASSLWAIGGVYSFQGDNQQGLDYMVKAKEMYSETHSEHNIGGALINIGASYINLDQLDSSRIYLTRHWRSP